MGSAIEPSQDTFARRVMKVFQSVQPHAEVRYDKEEFRLLVFEGGEHRGTANLGNVYAEHCGLPVFKTCIPSKSLR